MVISRKNNGNFEFNFEKGNFEILASYTVTTLGTEVGNFIKNKFGFCRMDDL